MNCSDVFGFACKSFTSVEVLLFIRLIYVTIFAWEADFYGVNIVNVVH